MKILVTGGGGYVGSELVTELADNGYEVVCLDRFSYGEPQFGIKYEKSLEKPTFFGLQWWGDRVSNKWLPGVNKNFKVSIDDEYFFKRDIKFFECLAEDIIKFYKYNFIFDKKKKI